MNVMANEVPLSLSYDKIRIEDQCLLPKISHSNKVTALTIEWMVVNFSVLSAFCDSISYAGWEDNFFWPLCALACGDIFFVGVMFYAVLPLFNFILLIDF